jgi:hypothetical protein
MQIMIMLIFLVIWLLALWIGSIALEATGMERSRARFQALSAISGTGFTTSRAEEVVENPRRRIIISTLMFVGNAGIISFLVALIIFMRSDIKPPTIPAIVITVAVLLFIVLVIALKVIDNITNLITRIIKQGALKTGLRIIQVMYSNDDVAVMKIRLGLKLLKEPEGIDIAALESKGLKIIAVEKGYNLIKDPAPDTKLTIDDRIICFGDPRNLSNFR